MTSHPSSLISLRNIGVSYRRSRSFFGGSVYHALRDVSFDIKPGDSLGILGRNGAGKSTLLRVLAGIIGPDKGSLVNANARTALLALQVGFDPQLDGRTNAILSGILLGFSKHEVLEKLDEIIEFSELGVAIDEPIKVYSTGMRARLGFSVAVHLDPDILLIDEVLGVGDADFRKKSSELLHDRLQSEHTVVLVSHSASTIKQLCNRAVWIEQGVTHMDGDAIDVSNAYEASSPGAASADK